MKKFLKNNCVSLDTLRQYKRGTLSSKKKTVVEAHLSTCDLCQFAMDHLEEIDVQELTEDVTRINNTITDRLFATKRRKRQSVFLRVAAALAFLLAIGIAVQLFVNNNASSANLYGAYYRPYEVPATLIRSTEEKSPSISAPLAEAIATYTNTPYQKSTRPTSFDQEPNQRALMNLLYGLTALEKENLTTALLLLKKAEKSNTKFAEDATWYLALAYLKLEDSTKSVNYLDKILLLGEGFYFDKASALKAQLLK